MAYHSPGDASCCPQKTTVRPPQFPDGIDLRSQSNPAGCPQMQADSPDEMPPDQVAFFQCIQHACLADTQNTSNITNAAAVDRHSKSVLFYAGVTCIMLIIRNKGLFLAICTLAVTALLSLWGRARFYDMRCVTSRTFYFLIASHVHYS